MNRAVIYARVSTEDQAREGYSLEAQMEMLRVHCNEVEFLDIVGEFVDEGYTGRNINRPAYREMMSRMDEWDALVVIKMDRIHRNSMNFMNMMDTFNKRGKRFISSTESLDTDSAMGKFVMDMIQRIAQLESEQIGERTYQGMREKAEIADGIMGFTPPFGYGIEDGELIANDEELAIVKDMYDMYLNDDMTMDEICYRLNYDYVTTRKGNLWTKQNLRYILHNPIYAGYMRWDDVLIPHKSTLAITKEDFNRLQEKMLQRVRDPNKRNMFAIP